MKPTILGRARPVAFCRLGALGVLLLTPACNQEEQTPNPGQASRDGGLPLDSGTTPEGGTIPDGGTEPTCALGIQLTGEVQKTLSIEQDITCVPVESSLSGLDVVYLTSAPVTSITLRIGDVVEGQPGGPFAAGVNILLSDKRYYETGLEACNVTITENRLTETQTDRRKYQVAGTGTCDAAIAQGTANGSIAIADLNFRIPAVWRD